MRVRSFGEGGVELFLRAWLSGEDYWTAYYDVTEAVQASFVTAGLTPPERYINVRLLEKDNDKDGNNCKN